MCRQIFYQEKNFDSRRLTIILNYFLFKIFYSQRVRKIVCIQEIEEGSHKTEQYLRIGLTSVLYNNRIVEAGNVCKIVTILFPVHGFGV